MLIANREAYKTINSSELSIISLYEIFYGDLVVSPTGAETYVDVDGNPCSTLCFTSHNEDILYEGKTYKGSVISHDGETQDASGKVTETQLLIGNYDRLIQSYISLYKLERKKVIISSLVLNASNGVVWTSGAEFRVKSIYVKDDFATFTLSSGLDVLSITFPNRIIRGLFCRWKFKGYECKYSGTDTECALTWNDCIAKQNTRNFGGAPGIINERFYF